MVCYVMLHYIALTYALRCRVMLDCAKLCRSTMCYGMLQSPENTGWHRRAAVQHLPSGLSRARVCVNARSSVRPQLRTRLHQPDRLLRWSLRCSNDLYNSATQNRQLKIMAQTLSNNWGRVELSWKHCNTSITQSMKQFNSHRASSFAPDSSHVKQLCATLIGW